MDNFGFINDNDILDAQTKVKKQEFDLKLEEIEDDIAVGDFEGDGVIDGANEIMLSIINDPEMRTFWVKNPRFYFAKLKITYKLADDTDDIISRFDEICTNMDYKKAKLHAEKSDPELFAKIKAIEETVAQKTAEEAERKRIEEEEAARKAAEEAERKAERRAAEEAERKRKAEEARKAAEEAERKRKEEVARKAREEAERKRKAEEARKAAEEAERKRREEEARLLQEKIARDFTIEYGVLKKYNGTDSFITIPDSVTSIGYAAFRNCTELRSVTIPNSVKDIGTDAFSFCSGLTSIVIPNSVTFIDSFAFAYCTGLRTISIPDSVTTIDSYAFTSTGLTRVTVSKNCYIASTAFEKTCQIIRR